MMGYPQKTRISGFTIIELLIVVVVIGVLAAIVTVSYNGVQNAAKDKTVLSDAEAVAAEITRYSTKNAGVLGSSVAWYSGGSSNPNIQFTPSPSNVVDIVAGGKDYCVRVFNPGSQYSSITTAYTKGSSEDACTNMTASIAAGGTWDSSLVGWWKMNGDLTDSTGSSNAGIVVGPTLTTGQNGSANGAYSFDGVNDYISFPQQLPRSVSRLTVSIWIKAVAGPSAEGGHGYAVHRSANISIGQSVFWLGVLGGGGNYAASINGNYTTGNTGISANETTWRLLTLTYDGSQQYVYLDGIQRATSTVGAVTNSQGGSITLGSSTYNIVHRPMKGTLDDLRIYDRALSQPEVQALYTAGAS